MSGDLSMPELLIKTSSLEAPLDLTSFAMALMPSFEDTSPWILEGKSS